VRMVRRGGMGFRIGDAVRGARRVCVGVGGCVAGVVFFGSVKRLVRPAACRGSGWSDPYPRGVRGLFRTIAWCVKGSRVASQGVRVCDRGVLRSGDLRMVPGHGGCFEREKGIRWMPWHQEAMKDVARCEKPRGAASRR
jgi:hypothetical protein